MPEVVGRLRSAGCVFAEDEAQLLLAAADTPSELATLVDRRVAGEPLEHVLGWAEFCGLRILVEPGVFVPRRRTEYLVAEAVALAPPRPLVVDMCCGSGGVGAALLAVLTGTSSCTPSTATPPRCGAPAATCPPPSVPRATSSTPLPRDLRGRVDLLVVNAPYVPTGELDLLPPEARDHEPQVALDGGPDGLDVQRRVVAAAPRWLAPGGHLLIETSERQVGQTEAAMAGSGLDTRVTTSQELEATVVVGTRPHR